MMTSLWHRRYLAYESTEEGERLCALKLHMINAYDRVEWNFLKYVMFQLSCDRV